LTSMCLRRGHLPWRVAVEVKQMQTACLPSVIPNTKMLGI
jgi:hypothetical protein